MQGALPPFEIGAAVALLMLVASACAQFRHLGPALIGAFSPMPGYVAALAFSVPGRPVVYLCGFVLSLVSVSDIARRVCNGASASEAVERSMRAIFAVLIGPLALVICVTAVLALIARDPADLALPFSVLLCGMSGLILPPVLTRLLPFGEEFIARANRFREQREHWLDRLSFVVQLRWSWSVAGIAVIFAVLGFFGGESSGAAWPFAATVVLPVTGVVAAVIAYAAIRDVRRVMAFLLTVLVLTCIAYWLCGQVNAAQSDLLLSLAISSIPALALAAQSAIFARAGDSVAVATLRSLERLAVSLTFFCFAAAIAACALGVPAAGVLIPAGGIGALIVFPALTTALHDLFPRRVSLDAYKIR